MANFSFTSVAQSIIDKAVLPVCAAGDKAVAVGVPAILNKTQVVTSKSTVFAAGICTKIAQKMDAAAKVSGEQLAASVKKYEAQKPVVESVVVEVTAEQAVVLDAALLEIWMLNTPAEKLAIAASNMVLFSKMVSLEKAAK